MPDLTTIYQNLFARYGDLHWWPAKTPYEVMVGAILTQNTAWSNVEKVIRQFADHLTPERIQQMPLEELQDMIRPAGFFKQKSLYLKALTEWFMRYGGRTEWIKSRPLDAVRRELSALHGVGNETADSILLYALDFPSFVVDAYTLRLFKRFPLDAGTEYMQVKAYIEKRLPAQALLLYKRFHALIVQNGKEHCRKKARCTGCPLSEACQKLAL